MSTERTTERWSSPTHLLLGIGSILVGIALFAASLSPGQLAVLTGAGLAIVGVALIVRSEPRSPRWLRLGSGAALIALGGAMALWPDSGAPWLARGVAAALVLHGIVTGIGAWFGDEDRRASGLIAALAGIVFGIVAFSWPVLTLALFRLGVGAWFVFLGARMVFELWSARTGRDPRPARSAASGIRATILRWGRTLSAVLALLLAAGVAYGSAQLLSGTPLPAPGAFYAPPDQVPSEPGTLIRSEPLTTGVPAGAQAWRILYTTTHPDGSPAVSSGTVLAPAKTGDDPLPLLSIAHGTTGVVDGCAPSLGQAPFSDGAGTAMADMVTEHGWVAVTSDYVGMGTEGTAAYLVGEAEARNVLDASRAVQQLDGFATTRDTVVWGHSQGGQGSLWTGQIAEQYAPELTVLGVAAFAPAADLYGLAEADKSNAGGKTVSAYIAATWNDVFPELELEQHLTPGSAGPVEKISALCFSGNDAIAGLLRGSQVPNQIFPDSLLAGPFGDLLKQQTPAGPWPAPVLLAQGLADPLVLPSLQQQYVDDRCAAGEAIDYRTFEGLGHVELVGADSTLTPQIVEWTLDRWNGEAAPSECTSSTYPGTQG